MAEEDSNRIQIVAGNLNRVRMVGKYDENDCRRMTKEEIVEDIIKDIRKKLVTIEHPEKCFVDFIYTGLMKKG